MRRKIKEVICIIMTLAIIISAHLSFPITAKAATTNPPSQIIVGADSLYDSSLGLWRTVGNGWKYNTKTNTLYLHGSFYQTQQNTYSVVKVLGDINIVIDGPTIINNAQSYILGIYVEGNCNLNLKDKLTIKSGGGIAVENGKLNITGKGSVSITAKGSLYGGIFAKKALTINGVPKVLVTSTTMYGIHTNGGGITIKNSKISSTGYVGGIAAFYGNLKIQGKSGLTNVTAISKAPGGAGISVIKTNKTELLGADARTGSGKVSVTKPLKVSTPSRYSFKSTALRRYCITNYSTGVKNKVYIKIKMYTIMANGKPVSRVVIK